MTGDKIETGTIMEIPLSHRLGYCYCQILLFKEVVCIVFDYRSETSLKGKFIADLFTQKEVLCNPFVLSAIPKTRGKYKWNIIKKESPILETCPDFRMDSIESELPVKVIVEGDLAKGLESHPWSKSCHLPYWGHAAPPFLKDVLSYMYFYQEHGAFDSSEEVDNDLLFARGVAVGTIDENFKSISEDIRYRVQR
jgi:hypothetical protein